MRRLLLVLLLALAPAAAPAAASAWSTPVRTPLPRAGELQAGFAGDGAGIVVARDGDHLSATLRPAGGAFGPAQELGLAGDGVFGSTWTLAVGANGRAMVVWQGARNNEIHVATREPGATSFETQLVAHGQPDEPYYDSVQSLAAAVGADGHAYLAWTDGDGATMMATDPGSRTFRRVGHVDSVVGPPWNAGYALPGVALAADRGGTRVSMLTTRLVTDASANELWIARWSATGGAEPAALVVREPQEFSTEGQFPERPISAAGDAELVGASGARATFFLHRYTSTRTIDNSAFTHFDQLAEIDAGGDGTPAPPTVVDSVSNPQSDDTTPVVSAGFDGTGLMGWAPPPDQSTGLAQVVVRSRTTTDAPFGPVTTPFAAQPWPDGERYPFARVLGLAATAPGSGYVIHGSGTSVVVSAIGPSAPVEPPLTVTDDADGDLGTVVGAGDGRGRAMVAMNRLGRFNASSVWVTFDEHPVAAPSGTGPAPQSEGATTPVPALPAAPSRPTAASPPAAAVTPKAPTLSSRRFAWGRGIGPLLRFTVDRPGTARLTLRAIRGHAKPRTATVDAAAGTNRVRIARVLGRSRPAPGLYTLTIRDAAGHSSSLRLRLTAR